MSPSEIQTAVTPTLLRPLPADVYPLLAQYLQLLTHWNQKMNLTAVRDLDVLVRLHLAECLRAAQSIPVAVETVLDFGSGAGFPGIPIQIVRPDLRVTLAESQKKKAAFLREVVRELGLTGASIHAGRVEDMPLSSVFDLVTLRAVDKMGDAIRAAIPRIQPSRETRPGWCMVLTSQSEISAVTSSSVDETGANRIGWEIPDAIPRYKSESDSPRLSGSVAAARKPLALSLQCSTWNIFSSWYHRIAAIVPRGTRSQALLDQKFSTAAKRSFHFNHQPADALTHTSHET